MYLNDKLVFNVILIEIGLNLTTRRTDYMERVLYVTVTMFIYDPVISKFFNKYFKPFSFACAPFFIELLCCANEHI